MIHELIDPKKKTNRASSTSKNTKTFQEPKTISEEINFEGSDSENKESSSATFIPPWLRNSLGLNQRNNLSHATGTSDLKSTKLVQRGKESSQNELESLKGNTAQQDCCKKVTENFEILPEDCPQEESVAKGPDHVHAAVKSNERTIPIYWDVRCKESETELNCTNADTKPLKKEDSKVTSAEGLTTADIEKLKEEDKKRLKLIKQRNKLRKRMMSESKQSELDKNEMDFLLEMKAREALDNYMKGDVNSVSSEMRHLEAKLLLLSAKSHDLSGSKLNQQEIRMLQEVKNQGGSLEKLERVFEHVKDVNLRGFMRNSGFLAKNLLEKRQEAKEEKCMREVMQNEGKCRQADKQECLLSTDDEKDIKWFSEFLSKNKNLDEKRKCLEEVRNYFERKRRTRLWRCRFMEEEKAKANFQADGREELSKEKVKSRETYRSRRSKFALCDEEVVEKAVDEALQKFVELYHFRVSPSVMYNMKKNILQAIATDSLDTTKSKESVRVALVGSKINLDLLNLPEKELEKGKAEPMLEADVVEVMNKDSGLAKEVKTKNKKRDNSGEQVSKPVSESDVMENEKLKRLKKEFDVFLNSVQAHVDVTNVKLQSIILEKEEQTASTQNVQFVYNFTKKALESEKADHCHSLKEVFDSKNRRDMETQTVQVEPGKRSVKIQVLEQKTEQSLQTETKVFVTQDTQTDGGGLTVQEIKELRNSDINPGLYRMVKSKEVGKFYLYPEQVEAGKEEVCEKINSSLVKEKKFNKKRNVVKVFSSEKARERQVALREREKGKLRRSKRTSMYTLPQPKGNLTKKRKKDETSENSISCLYFKNFDKKGSDSISSKKEVDLTDENLTGGLELGEDLRLEQSKEEHLGCFWFWDGEKISTGCDLKMHVENLLKEKLSHLPNFEGSQSEFGVKGSTLSKKESHHHLLTGKASEKNLDVKNANAIFCFTSVRNAGEESAFAENESLDERKRASVVPEKKEENGETDENLASISREGIVKNVAPQDSHLKFLSLKLFKQEARSGSGATLRRTCAKRNVVFKPTHGKVLNVRKAQDFLRAIEEIKKIKLELANSKKVNSSASESLLECSSSTTCYKHPTEDPLSVVLGLKEGSDMEEISNPEINNKIKKLMGLVDREIQTSDLCDPEDANSGESRKATPALDNQKYLDLIGRVLSRVSQKQKEHLWNDVRHFIKTKLDKDLNDEGMREVCIEIEQALPKAEHGKVKHSVLAKGHYSKNEGEVEVEIDLTLDDLARILRQRQKKIRRRNISRSSKSKNFLSSSSGQSDLTRDDIRRYQRYLRKFATLGHGLPHEKDAKSFKKNKGN